MKSYIFHVSLPGTGRTWRKIELVGNQTLHDLHFAIQDAFEWDADHLYSFFMSGKAWDQSSEYALPERMIGGEGVFDSEDEIDEEVMEPETIKEFLEMLKELSPQEQSLIIQKTSSELGLPESNIQELLGAFLSIETPEELISLLSGEAWEDEEAGDATTTTLDALDLKQGQTFMYLFDYGDEWRFKVRVSAINANALADVEYPHLVESIGTAPLQYPN